MIDAGKMDRRITIERRHDVVGAAGTVSTVWTAHATVWAERIDPVASEAAGAGGMIETDKASFRLRHLNITPADRILFEGRTLNIKTVKEIGRRVSLEIDCESEAA